MEWIYIKADTKRWNEFLELLDSKGIACDFLGNGIVMIHKARFISVGKILDNSMIESFASTIEGLL